MASKPLNVESLLRASFLKAELECLHASPQFTVEWPTVVTAEQFQRLCELGEQLLAESDEANPAARQLRQSVRLSNSDTAVCGPVRPPFSL